MRMQSAIQSAIRHWWLKPPSRVTATRYCLGMRSLRALAVTIAAMLTLSGCGPSAEEEAAQAAQDARDAFPLVIDACGASDYANANVIDGGAALSLKSQPDGGGPGVPIEDFMCILGGLGLTDTVREKMASTRAMDGRQEGSWGPYVASWTYHPDDGLNVLVEVPAP